jgi:hypothetical protein
MDFYKPKNLLSADSIKTRKGEKKNFKTFIMYLSPFTDNSKGINLCSHASAGCADACLFNSGNARFNRVQTSRRNKTEYFLADRKGFLAQLDKEIGKLEAKYLKNDFELVIRLNGTSDIVFEKFIVRDNKNIFELYPKIQFYDYTKNNFRFKKVQASNYHLTFSRSESNGENVVEVLNNGGNVAVVFENTPKTFLGYEVINGDEDDLRFNDKKNVIVGLKYKRASVKGGGEKNDEAMKSGFVVTDEAIKMFENIGKAVNVEV